MRTRPRFAALLAGLAVTATAMFALPAGATALTSTVHITVRPVDHHGVGVAGYAITIEHNGSGFNCYDQSSNAVDAGIDICGVSATYTPACWPSVNHTTLCLRDARVKTLVRIPYHGTFVRKSALAHPYPLTLVLAGGEKCRFRVGGAGGSLPAHPSWVQWYYCTNGSLWGTVASGGIDRSHPVWTVRYTTNGSQTVAVRKIAASYVVGTAA